MSQTTQVESEKLDEVPSDAFDEHATTVDYIVIGSGAGGGPLAARLALGGMRVLVLEQGHDAGAPNTTQESANAVALYHCPGLHEASTEPALHGNTGTADTSWPQYVRHYADDELQKNAAKGIQSTPWPNNIPRQLYPRSKALGGCTAHHAMIAIAPPDEDWQEIADMTGDDSWRPSAMRLMFQRLERHSRGKHATLLGHLWNSLLDKWNPDRHLAGERGSQGWLDISFTDPKLALGDRRMTNVIKNAAMATESNQSNLLWRWLKRLIAGRFYQDLDLNDTRTMRNSTGGICLLPLAISSGVRNPRQPDVVTPPNQRRGPREFLLETRAALNFPSKKDATPSPLKGKLWLVTNALVNRIVFHKKTSESLPHAAGVEFQGADKISRVCYARREVICSGGAFATPQLLMLSGIGDAKDLAALDIAGPRDAQGVELTSVIDLPGVGRNLGDRYELSVISEVADDWPALKGATFTPNFPDQAYNLWKKDRSGIYATNGGVLGLLHKSKSRLAQQESSENRDYLTGRQRRLAPDLFIMGFPAAFRGYYPGWSFDLLKKIDNYPNTEQPQAPLQPGAVRNLWSWTILKAWSRNKGEVKLVSNDPGQPVDINFHYFEEQKDNGWIFNPDDPDLAALEEAVAVVRRVNRNAKSIFKKKRLFKDNDADKAELQPGSSSTDGSPQLRTWIVAEAWGHHACGTCRIGKDRWQSNPQKLVDKEGVLDSQFRVHGVTGLRVVDASVFPKIPGYFLAVPTFMVAEKAAVTILAEPSGLPREIRAAESAALQNRRKKANATTTPSAASSRDPMANTEHKDYPLPENTVGLACSGGGIRSATFCLGFIQTLARLGRLRDLDYLSTASGGGYVGAFIGTMIQRAASPQVVDPIGHAQQLIADHQTAPLRWLRTKAQYLVSEGDSDRWQSLAVYWRNLLTVHVVMIALGLAVFGVLRCVAELIPADYFLKIVGFTDGPNASIVDQSLFALSPWWVVIVAWLLVAVLPSAIAYWLSPHVGSAGQISFFAAIYWTVLLGCLLVMAILPGGFWLAATAIVALVTALLWFFVVGIGHRNEEPIEALPSGQMKRNRLTRAISVTTRVLIFAMLFLLVDTVAGLIAEGTLPNLLLAWGAAIAPILPFVHWISVPIRSSVSGKPSSPKNQSTADRLPVLAVAIAFALIGFAFTATDTIIHFAFNKSWSWGFCLMMFGLLLSLAVAHAMEFLNGSTMLNLYSSRLVRTFLGASNPVRWGNDPTTSLQNVLRFHETDDIPFSRYHPEQNGGPLHLIGVCVNETVDLASKRDIADRLSLPMCVSPVGISVGVRFHGLWENPQQEIATFMQRLRKWLNGFDAAQETVLRPVGPLEVFHVFGNVRGRYAFIALPTLGSWIAISGAAFGTGLGRHTTKAASILAGLSNARVGYWWDTGLRRVDRPAVTIGNFWQRLVSIPGKLFPMQSMLLSEWFGRFEGPSVQFWNLSDGGHFDNSAVYELIRRRVPLILALDGSADPQARCDDLAEMIRRVRVDFGAEVDFLSPPIDLRNAGVPVWIQDWLQAASIGGLAELAQGQYHAALAKVTWPDTPGEDAWVVYIKAGITGDESADVTNFKNVYNDFPHESTTDQFFNESQWESYRKLGQHIGEKVLQ